MGAAGETRPWEAPLTGMRVTLNLASGRLHLQSCRRRTALADSIYRLVPPLVHSRPLPGVSLDLYFLYSTASSHGSDG
jgi:hypothetical protein